MKVLAIVLDDNERPATVTVEMTVDEAAATAKHFGGIPGDKMPHGCGDIYDRLTSSFFNCFWEDGVDGCLRGKDE